MMKFHYGLIEIHYGQFSEVYVHNTTYFSPCEGIDVAFANLIGGVVTFQCQ